MNEELLGRLAHDFSREARSSEEVRDHVAEHRRRSARAQRMLTEERIPTLSKEELRELFLDTDAFSVWPNKEWRFEDRVRKVGLDRLREALLDLVQRAERGLTAENLKQIWSEERVLTTLVASEFLAYRFPRRYWTYTETVTLPALRTLGEDVRASMPRGQKSDPYLYFAVGPHMDRVRRALTDAGLADADNLLADLFLFWVKTEGNTSSPPSSSVWLFQANPKYYDLAAELENFRVGDEDSWSVKRYGDEMRAGDNVVLWQAGKDAGIYAIGQLLGAPYKSDLHPTKEELEEHPYLGAPQRVNFRYTQILEEPIYRDALKEHEVLRGMQVLKAPQATNFRVAHQEWEAIKRLVSPDANTRRFWKVSPGEGAWAWDEFRRLNVIAIGYWEGNLALSAPASLEELRDDLEASGGTRGGDIGHASRQLWRFYGEMKPGDLVCAYGHKQVLGWGEVLGDYSFERDDNFQKDAFGSPHRRRVVWNSFEPFPIAGLTPSLQTKLQRREAIVPLEPEEWDEIQGVAPPTRIDLMEVISDSLAAKGFYFTPWQIATFYTALQTKGFVILSGISGTGKTKLAQHFAGMLPQPQTPSEPSEEQVVITVKPYMLKYNRFIIPKLALKYFDLPAPGEKREVEVSLEDKHQSCLLTHNETDYGTYLGLLLKGPVRERFLERFAVGDQFVLEPELDEESSLIGFRLVPGLATPTAPGSPSQPKGQNALFLSVRPDWRDGKNLLGYFNPLTATYQWTPFLHFLLRAAESYRKREGLAWFVILDEMNLAHVEYYFADLLSVLESGRDAKGWTNEPLRLVDVDEAPGELPPKELRLPPNLYVVGTVNIDETTRAFSPKVLDRAFSLELSEVDFADYPVELGDGPPEPSEDQRQNLLASFTRKGTFARVDKEIIAAQVNHRPVLREQLQNLNEQLKPHALHFGYRVFDEIVAFSAAAEENGLFSQMPGFNPPLDTAVLMKVLPKFHGARSRLEAPLKALLAWCLDPESPDPETIELLVQKTETTDEVIATLSAVDYRCPYTAGRALRMLQDLYTEGFTAFG